MMGSTDEQPWDPYREIHKAARLALYPAAVKTGSADAANDGHVGAPPVVWDQFHAAARRALTPEEFAAVAARIGLRGE